MNKSLLTEEQINLLNKKEENKMNKKNQFTF